MSTVKTRIIEAATTPSKVAAYGPHPKPHNAENDTVMSMYRRIDTIMRSQKPFLDPDFSRDDMLALLNTNKNKLNEALVAGAGCNFSDYICRLRLNETLLAISSSPDMALSEISFKCGFNTYSSFYRSFVRHYGMNPIEYKRLHHNREGGGKFPIAIRIIPLYGPRNIVPQSADCGFFMPATAVHDGLCQFANSFFRPYHTLAA